MGGRKRHLVVDCLGLVLAVAVTAASVQDRDAAVPLLERLRKMYFSLAPQVPLDTDGSRHQWGGIQSRCTTASAGTRRDRSRLMRRHLEAVHY
ncbi:transposase [Streptomyces sp. AC555_RSS877]|uniref:transposase n=1 Tax=Streptomyces sp. AC555_RSS877 TaxID=2823688 RepID=UPI001C26F713|nr:transposase [Streptomyces sp. AC555_RSS877]